MIKFLILFLTFLSLSASELKINYADVKLENFTMGQLRENNTSYTIKEVQNLKFKDVNNQTDFSGSLHNTWYRLKIYNSMKIDRQLYLHDNFAYFSKEITVYLFAHNRLIQKTDYNVLDNSNNRLIGGTLVYPFNIKAESHLTLFIKKSPMLSHLIDLNIYDEKNSMLSLTHKTFVADIIVLILIALALYNIFLYFFNRRKEFVYYALYLLNGAFGLFFMYGSIFNHFNIYGTNIYYFSICIFLVTLFLSLFLKFILELKTLNKRLNSLFNTLIIFPLINVFIAIFDDMFLAVVISKFIFIYSFLIMTYLSFYLLKIKHKLAKIFIFAYSTYIVGTVISILSLANIIPLNNFTFYASGIGLVIEALLFSYLLHRYVETLEKKLREQKELIIQKNKKAQLGDMMSAIIHQWKQPLARITSTTALLKFKLMGENSIPSIQLSDKLSLIDKDIEFLSNTIDDFKDFFKPDSTPVEVDISQLINKAIALSTDDTLTKEINIKTDINFTHTVTTYKNELLHVVLNLIQNAKEAFLHSDEESKLIKIFAYIKEEKLYIDITDNAGGIKAKNLNKIFDENYSTKENKTGAGLGLYITKFILEEHLKGSIKMINIQGGTMFRIVI